MLFSTNQIIAMDVLYCTSMSRWGFNLLGLDMCEIDKLNILEYKEISLFVMLFARLESDP